MKNNLSGRLRRSVGRLPFLWAKGLVCTDDYFAWSDRYQNEMYTRLAEAIWEERRPSSVVDVGCGTGHIIASLAERGVAVRGIDGSRHAIRRSQVARRILQHDLEHGVPALGRFDLCICLEVAEHLTWRSARVLVKGLTSLSDEVLFSAATPGQGGELHLNEQPHSFWINVFASEGYVFSGLALALVATLGDFDEPSYIKRNLISFARTNARAVPDGRPTTPTS